MSDMKLFLCLAALALPMAAQVKVTAQSNKTISVEIDGKPVLTCLRKPEQMEGVSVNTLEGLPELTRKALAEASRKSPCGGAPRPIMCSVTPSPQPMP